MLDFFDEEPTEALGAEEPTESPADAPVEENSADPVEPESGEISKEDTTPAERSFTVERDGKSIEYVIKGDISDEELEDNKLGHLRTINYNEKMNAISQERKQIEEKNEQTDTVLQKLYSQLQYEKDQFDSPEMSELEQYDNDEYKRLVREHRDRVDVYNEASKARQEEIQSKENKRVEEELKKLPDLIPEWLDEKAQEEGIKEIAKDLRSRGATDQDLSFMGSKAYFYQVMHEALKYRKMQENLNSKRDNSPPSSTSPGSTAQEKPEPRGDFEDLWG